MHPVISIEFIDFTVIEKSDRQNIETAFLETAKCWKCSSVEKNKKTYKNKMSNYVQCEGEKSMVSNYVQCVKEASSWWKNMISGRYVQCVRDAST